MTENIWKTNPYHRHDVFKELPISPPELEDLSIPIDDVEEVFWGENNRMLDHLVEYELEKGDMLDC